MSENPAAATPLSPAALAEIEARLAAIPNLPWTFGASYEVWQRQEWGARRVAAVTEVPNDTEAATGRYSVVDFIAKAPDDLSALVGEVRRLRAEIDAAELEVATHKARANAAEKERDRT